MYKTNNNNIKFNLILGLKDLVPFIKLFKLCFLPSLLILILSLFVLSCLGNLSILQVKAKEPLLITEINFAGSVNDGNCKQDSTKPNRCGFDKWLEITNFHNQETSLQGYSLRFLKSLEKNSNLDLSNIPPIPAKSSILIGYKEIDFNSSLFLINQKMSGISGKIRNISNQEKQTIQIELLFNGSIVQDIDLKFSDFNYIPNKQVKKSIELDQLGSWRLSEIIFLSGQNFANYGTPKGILSSTLDLDEDKIIESSKIPVPIRPSNLTIQGNQQIFESVGISSFVNTEQVLKTNIPVNTIESVAKNLVNFVPESPLSLKEKPIPDLDIQVKKQMLFENRLIQSKNLLATQDLYQENKIRVFKPITFNRTNFNTKNLKLSFISKKSMNSISVSYIVNKNLAKFAQLAFVCLLFFLVIKNFDKKEIDKLTNELNFLSLQLR